MPTSQTLNHRARDRNEQLAPALPALRRDGSSPDVRTLDPAFNGGRTPPAETFSLKAGDVHVWRATLDQPDGAAPAGGSPLAPEEVEQAERFHFGIDRRRFIARRSLLRILLGHYLEIDPSRVMLSQGPNGKPVLQGVARGRSIYFNATHSDGLALVAITRSGDVGVDVERVRQIPEWKQIAASAFTPRENAWLQSLAEEPCPLAFLRAWTRHEALLKATGQGLGGGKFGPQDESDFTLYPLTPVAGFVGTLAVRHRLCRLAFLTWQSGATGFSNGHIAGA